MSKSVPITKQIIFSLHSIFINKKELINNKILYAHTHTLHSITIPLRTLSLGNTRRSLPGSTLSSDIADAGIVKEGSSCSCTEDATRRDVVFSNGERCLWNRTSTLQNSCASPTCAVPVLLIASLGPSDCCCALFA